MTTFVVIGAGGLGAPVLLALAAAGAGRPVRGFTGAIRIVIVDHDVVDLSNLQRQVLYRTADVGRPKAEAAKAALARRWPAVPVEAVRARFDEGSARALLHDADVVCEGSDDLATKFFVNDVCAAAGKRFVIGGVLRREGQVFPVRPGTDACYRCLFEAPPETPELTCADAGVFGATCGEVGGFQARAALALAGGGDPEILGKFHTFSPSGRRALAVRPRPGCTACSEDAA